MKIEFTKDYASYKKGDNIDTKNLGSILTSKLIRKHKVAKEYKPATKKGKDEILGK